MNTIVFDIETSNFFTDPGVGPDNFEALHVSAVGVYSYKDDSYRCFGESELALALPLFRDAEAIMGFSINRYDVPVLNLAFQRLPEGRDINLWAKTRIDLAERLEDITKRRISLSRLAFTNLGEKKEHHGSEAIALYKEGRIAELQEYCLNDVRITKELYDCFLRDQFLLVPDKATGDIMRVDFESHAMTVHERVSSTPALF